MFPGSMTQIDFIEELRLRRWALENFVPASQRDRGWHPVILDEMSRKDRENRSNETGRNFSSPERH
jgi:hypothetical protein